MTCIRCGIDRPPERFEPRRRTCRDCVNTAARAARRRTYTSERHRWYEYRLTPEVFDAMVAAQGGRCAIFGRIPGTLAVDHDHRSGLVRGLLCGPCNIGLGHLRDQPVLCDRAADYLRGST